MIHDGLSSSLLRDMRPVLDDVVMADRQRRLVETVISTVEANWQTQRQEKYADALAVRDREHQTVLDVASQFLELIAERAEDVRNGRRAPEEVRGWLRDVQASHQTLTKLHRGVESTEDELSELEAMSPDDFQAKQYERFPLLVDGSPTLAALVEAEASRVRMKAMMPSKQQMDADQDAMLAERGIRFPASRRPQGW